MAIKVRDIGKAGVVTNLGDLIVRCFQLLTRLANSNLDQKVDVLNAGRFEEVLGQAIRRKPDMQGDIFESNFSL